MSQEQDDQDKMEEEYKTLIVESSRLAEIGDYLGAIHLLEQLIDLPWLPDMDRAIMEMNKAILFGKLGQSTQALYAYDLAIALADPDIAFQLKEHKAAYLAEIGWTAESLLIYKALLETKDITHEDEQRFKNNIAILEQRLKT